MEGKRRSNDRSYGTLGIEAIPVKDPMDDEPPVMKGLANRATVILGRAFKSLESVVRRSPLLARVYEELFYSRILHRELDMSRLPSGSRVLVVGSGHLPMTALHLARHGHEVTAVDNDPHATASASSFVARVTPYLNVRFGTADGVDADTSAYDAVWVTFNVTPKNKVLERMLQTLSEGAQVVFRNPRGMVTRLYAPVDADCLGLMPHRRRHLFGKESVMLVKGSCGGPFELSETEGGMTLACLQCGLQGVIARCPEDPVLNALGLRPGKTVVSISRQPFGGPLLASVDGRKVAIDAQVAASILLV